MGQLSSKRISMTDVNHLCCHTELDKNDIEILHKGFVMEYSKAQWNRDEFVKFYEGSSLSVYFLLLMFANFDKDKSGLVDFKEFLIAVDKVLSGSDDDKITWFFRIADKDGSGSVDLNEWKEAMGLYDKTTIDGAKIIFQQLDKDGDNTLNLKEFKRGCDEIEMLRKFIFESVNVIALYSKWKLIKNAKLLVI